MAEPKFSPIRDEIQNDRAYQHWMDKFLSKAPSTKRNADKAISIYLYYLRNEYDYHFIPEELIDNARKENKSDLQAYEKTLPKYLNGFIRYLDDDGYSYGSQSQIIGFVKAFYRSNEIFFDESSYRPKKPDPNAPQSDNKFFLKKKHIRKCLNAVNYLFLRAMVYTALSSGLSKVDLYKLTVGQYNQGYDSELKICHLKIKRQKPTHTYIHNTFISSEGCEAIKQYLDFRNGSDKFYDELTDIEKKQYIYSDDDYLFCKPSPNNAFLNYVDKNGDGYTGDVINGKKKIRADLKYRKFKDNDTDKYFQEVSDNVKGMKKKGVYSYFRMHNLRRFFSTQLAETELRADIREHFMGHSLGVSEHYVQFSDEMLKGEYLKFMQDVTISSASELEIYKNTEHKREIDDLNRRKNLAQHYYDESVNEMNLTIESYTREMQDITIQLQNEMLEERTRLYLESQRKTLIERIKRVKNSIISKKNKLEVELKQLEHAKNEIDAKYEE